MKPLLPGPSQAALLLDLGKLRDQVAPQDCLRVAELVRRVVNAQDTQDDRRAAIKGLVQYGVTLATLEAEADALGVDRSDLDPANWDDGARHWNELVGPDVEEYQTDPDDIVDAWLAGGL